MGPATILFDIDDERYIRTWFVPLEILARANGWDVGALHNAINVGHAPKPAYTLNDGTMMLWADYFAPIADPADLVTLPYRFTERFRNACRRLRRDVSDAKINDEYSGYMGGGYGACLKSVSPETIVLKIDAVEKIETLLASPYLDDLWSTKLHQAVEQLDAIEKPFAKADRRRFGPTSRDRLITDVRRTYPDVFAETHGNDVLRRAFDKAAPERQRASGFGSDMGRVAMTPISCDGGDGQDTAPAGE